VKYKVDFTPQALEDISKLDKAVIERVTRKIEWL
jgi:mRNA-degrading endonuclease RelE of RelBE toxin-antitoxin system